MLRQAQHEPRGGTPTVSRRRGWLAILGIVNLALMALILATLPGSALVLPGTPMAVSFLFTGMAAIVAALELRRAA